MKTSAEQTTSRVRAFLWMAGFLVALAGIQLFVFPEQTERFFAWTIDPPLTAAFLGACYWSSVVLEWSAARARTWAGARIAVPTVLVFTVLTLGVTMLHLDHFHLGPEFEFATRLVTWVWIAIYTLVPILLVVLLIGHARSRQPDPSRWDHLPTWVRALVMVQAVVFLLGGLVLLVAPESAAAWWPWSLTALTGRAIGAWVISLGVIAAHALWEDDKERVRPAAYSYLTLAILQTVALVRFPGDFAWTTLSGWVYLVFLASAVVVGAAVLWGRPR